MNSKGLLNPKVNTRKKILITKIRRQKKNKKNNETGKGLPVEKRRMSRTKINLRKKLYNMNNRRDGMNGLKYFKRDEHIKYRLIANYYSQTEC